MLTTARKLLIAATALSLCAGAMAAQDFGAFQVSDDGSIKIGGSNCASLVHYDSQWGVTQLGPNSYKSDAGYPKSSRSGWIDKGVLSCKSGSFEVERKYTPQPDGALLVEESVSSASPVATKDLSFTVSLPLDAFAGRSIQLGSERKTIEAEVSDEKAMQLEKPSFGSVLIPCGDYKLKIEGQGGVLLQDNRRFSGRDCSLRFHFDKSSGEVSSAKISLKLSCAPYDAKPLDLSSAMNMGFSDDVEGDGKGGWTDQGPENDLRMIKPGLLKLCGAPFSVVDPAKNGGKSCIVLSGSRAGGLKNASLNVSPVQMDRLCLLHASAWTPPAGEKLGTLSVSYQDGSKSEFPVIAGKQVGNWWTPGLLPDAQVAWTGENKSAFVGLYMTEFKLEPKPVSGLDFKLDNSDSVWMIVAASAANESLPKNATVPSYIIASKDWRPLEFPKRELQKGSALDFSCLLDAPAGKYGPVVIRDGRFEYEAKPGLQARFYGVNLCFTANFLEKAECEKLADLLVMCGYNSVRFHHFDNQLSVKGQPSTAGLDAAELDKFDYLFKCLKDRGVYITIDLFISRQFKKGQIPELDREITEHGDFKASVFILDSAMNDFQKFSKDLLLHVNPYTGMAWKDDPALLFVSLVNEDNIFSCWNRKPDIKAIYDAKFEEWLKAKGLEKASSEERNRLLNRFLIETYDKAYAKMSAFVKSLGARQPLTDQNMMENVPLSLMRDHYDYVDNHFYWDHPHFLEKPWRFPSAIKNKSAIEGMASCPSGDFQSRAFGKPYTITEFNWAVPCSYRAESGPLTGAYAALQGWDAVYRFAWSHTSKTVIDEGPCDYFNVATDPVNYLSDRIGVALFLRGDVAESKLLIPVVVDGGIMESPDAPLRPNFSKLGAKLGLVGKVGAVIAHDGKALLPSGAAESLPAILGDSDEIALAKLRSSVDFGKGSLDLVKKTAVSSTGEISLDAEAKTLKVVTPRSETLVFADKGSLDGQAFSASNLKGPATFFACSLDGKELKDSSRILVLHIVDVANSKMKFRDEKHTIIEAWGSLPLLASHGVADLKLKLSPGKEPKVRAIDLAGRNMGAPASQSSDDGSLSFHADNFAFEVPCMAYEVVR